MQTVLLQTGAVREDEHIVAAYRAVDAGPRPVRVVFWPEREETVRLLEAMDIPHLPLILPPLNCAPPDGAASLDWAAALTQGHLQGEANMPPFEGVDVAECMRSEPCWSQAGVDARRVVAAATGAIARRVRFMLMATQASLLLVWNGRTAYGRLAKATADSLGVPTAVAERGFFPSTMYLDKGYNEEATIAGPEACERICSRPPTEACAAFLDDFRRARKSVALQARESSREEIRRALKLPPEARWVFYAGQRGDYLTRSRTAYFESNDAILAALDSGVAQFPHTHVLYKPHPADEAAAPPDTGRIRTVSRIHLHSLIESAELVAVSSSYVGVEALALGKPVLYCGKTLVNSDRLALRAATAEEVLARVGDALSGRWSPDADAVASYVCYLAREFLLLTDGSDEGRIAERLLSLCGRPAAWDGDFALDEWARSVNALDTCQRYKESFEYLMSRFPVRVCRNAKAAVMRLLGRSAR